MKTKAIILAISFAGFLVSCMDTPEDPNKQLNEEIRLIDDYLAARGITGNNVLFDNNGLRFVFNYFGDDAPPKNKQTVILNYVGKLFQDESIFDSGQKNETLENISPDVLRYCASLMMKGASVKVFVPSQYGYGKEGTANVPPNSILIYQLALQEVVKSTAEQEQFDNDVQAIQNYLQEHAIENVVEHFSGIAYTIVEPGNGDSPTPYSSVSFEYKLTLLNKPETIVDQGTLTNISIFNGLIDGFKVALPLISSGTTAIFYIPSGLGYGTSAQGNIPANSNLVFEVKLTKVH